MDSNDVYVDTLFTGLTRPATVLGIHFFAFVIEIIVVAIIFLMIGNPLYLLIGVPVHGFLYLLSGSDPNRFAAMWVWLQTNGRCLNTKFWGGASFSPLSFKKWQE